MVHPHTVVSSQNGDFEFRHTIDYCLTEKWRISTNLTSCFLQRVWNRILQLCTNDAGGWGCVKSAVGYKGVWYVYCGVLVRASSSLGSGNLFTSRVAPSKKGIDSRKSDQIGSYPLYTYMSMYMYVTMGSHADQQTLPHKYLTIEQDVGSNVGTLSKGNLPFLVYRPVPLWCPLSHP